MFVQTAFTPITVVDEYTTPARTVSTHLCLFLVQSLLYVKTAGNLKMYLDEKQFPVIFVDFQRGIRPEMQGRRRLNEIRLFCLKNYSMVQEEYFFHFCPWIHTFVGVN